MAKEARHHHYISRCYLRGFAKGSGKHCRLTVANLESQQFFETNPRNVGGLRDFNRVQMEGFKPDALEGMLSNFEGQVATAIRNVAESSTFEGDDKIAILNLVALLAVRSPQQRENWRQFEEKIMKRILGLSLASKERWETQMQDMEKAGKGIKDPLSYEEMKAFYKKDEYDIKLNTEHHLALEFKGFEAVLPFLVGRKWKLYTTTEEEGLFITTDRPVVLTWNHPEQIPVMMRDSPGFGMQDTEVLFPLTRNTLLLGAFEGENGTVVASTPFVAGANIRMIHHAFEQVYSSKKVFPYLGPDLQFHHDRHFMERFQVRRRSAEKKE
jgi:hypothetical protein